MKKAINALKYLAMLVAGVFLFWLAFKNVDFGQVWAEIYNIDYLYIIIAFLITSFSHWMRAVRWNLLIKPMGYKVSSFNSFLAVMIGYFANLALPRMGEISRCFVLNRTNRVPVDKLIGTVVVERVVDVISLLIITVFTLIAEFEEISAFFDKSLGNKLKGNPVIENLLSFTGGVVFFSVLIVMILLVIFLYRRYSEAGFIVKARNLLMGFGEGLKSVAHMKEKWMFIAQSVFIWVLYYLAIYVSFQAVTFTDSLGALAALSVLVAGSFGFVVPVQGGIGAYHAAVSQILLIYGLSLQQGLTFAFVAHTFQTIVVLILGGMSFIIVTLSYRKIKSHDSAEAVKGEDT